MKKAAVRAMARLGRPLVIARAVTNGEHVLAVCVAANDSMLTFKATRDGFSIRTLSVAVDGRRPVPDSTVTAVASRLVNDLETYDCDTTETFTGAIVSAWEFDYSNCVGEVLDKLAKAKLL